MVQSILDKSINYPPIKKIEIDDVNYDATAYDVDIYGFNKTIALGQAKYAFIDKNIIYFPIYLIIDDHVTAQLGVYEIFSNELINVTDEDGDIDLTKLGQPLLYIFAEDVINMSLDEIKTSKIFSEAKSDSPAEVSEASPAEVSEATPGEVSEATPGEVSEAKSDSPAVVSESDSTTESLKEEASITSTDDNKEWIENFMSDNSYKIVNNEGGGDCLFAVIRDALSSVGDKVTVNELREKLAEEATNEIFLGYKLYYDELKSNFDENKLLVTQVKIRNSNLKTELSNTKDKKLQTSIVKEANDLKTTFDMLKKELITAKNNLDEYKFMSGVETLDQFKKLIKSCNFWGDTWAISTLERILKVKLVLLSREMWLMGDLENVLQCGQLNDDVLERQGKFEPQYYIILDYSGQHYQLITYKEKSAFTFSDLPEQVKKLIKNKCLEKAAGPYYLIPEFRVYTSVKDELEDYDPLLYDDNTVFQIYSLSADKPPGTGKPNEKISKDEVDSYKELSQIKNWRRKLTSIIDSDLDTIKEDPEKMDILKKTGTAKLTKFNKASSPTVLSELMEHRKTLLQH
tara:strand:- start:23483 stop:25201 length:1719 start_codon:yes stop_codon:yes gene_type:complete